MIPASELPRYATYEPLTGIFRSARDSGTKCKIGYEIGSLCDGYWTLKFEGKRYKAHRVAWALMTGQWPSEQIDHINGVRNDNHWSNLRLATQSQNGANSKLRKDNACGFKGVCFREDLGAYRAYIDMHGKRHHLGNFKTAEEASAARSAKAAEVHGEFARLA